MQNILEANNDYNESDYSEQSFDPADLEELPPNLAYPIDESPKYDMGITRKLMFATQSDWSLLPNPFQRLQDDHFSPFFFYSLLLQKVAFVGLI